MPRPVMCIYHGDCADGFTAAWAVRKRFPDAELFAASYQTPPPDVSGKLVLMVDFSYKRPVLEGMIASCSEMIVLDHHKTAIEELSFLPDALADWDRHVWRSERPRASKVFDLGRSGAGIAWDFFHAHKQRPGLVDYVEDRDLWLFALPSSREISAVVFSYEYTLDNWDLLRAKIDHDRGSVAAEGVAIERKHARDVAAVASMTKRRMTVGGEEVWCANAPHTLTSDIGELLGKGEPFAACYWDTPAGRVFSLRSPPGGADVSAVAKWYGGGGHKHASGFSVPFERLQELGLS